MNIDERYVDTDSFSISDAPDRIKCLVLMDTYFGPEPARNNGILSVFAN